ncbi:hypothetical protein WG66_006468 [Moniliophthora roreri]|nr:hypothetical protein WG66_006468 [Moniliophthora roreri]
MSFSECTMGKGDVEFSLRFGNRTGEYFGESWDLRTHVRPGIGQDSTTSYRQSNMTCPFATAVEE